MSTDLATVDTSTGELLASDLYPQDPQQLVTVATERANVLKTVIQSQGLAVKISGREYVTVEGWTTLAAMHHVCPWVEVSEALEDGSYRAIVILRSMITGRDIARAYGQCGGPTDGDWAKRSTQARESMAATRATAKACRLVFSWVMTLAGYAPTPAEEMGHLIEDARQARPPPTHYVDDRGVAQELAPQKPDPTPARTPGDRKLLTDKQLHLIQTKLARIGKAEKWLEMKMGVDSVSSIAFERVNEALEIIDEASA